MTQQVKHPLTPEAVETPAGDPGAPQTVVAQLRAIRALIPDYTQLTPEDRKKLVTVAKSTDPDFVQATINGVGSSPNAQGAVGKSADELRHETIDVQEWSAVEAEAAALLQGIATANLVRRYRVGQKALAVYTICTKLSKMEEHADLLPHVETMKRLNRFGRKLKKASEPVPAPAPAPATQTAA